jgi:hypothetical protein
MEERERCYSFIYAEMLKKCFYVRLTARHAMHLQCIISANALEIRAIYVQSELDGLTVSALRLAIVKVKQRWSVIG